MRIHTSSRLRFLCVLCALCGSTLFAQTSRHSTKPSSRPGGEIVPPPRRDVPGQRIALSSGELYIPDYFHPGETADVMVWFLGAAWCAEQSFYDAHKNAVLLVTNSATLKAGFPDAQMFDALLDEVSRAVKRPIGRICLTSFSGGYTAVRDLLRLEPIASRVNDVVLLDSLYAPRIGENKDRVDPDAMKPFVDFATRAAQGKTTFLFSQLYPPEAKYRENTTTLAADHLIDALHLDREAASAKTSRGTPILYRAKKGNCLILGCAGMTNQDHFDHFYASADLLRLTSFVDATAAEPKR
jgi:hypothetical protein